MDQHSWMSAKDPCWMRCAVRAIAVQFGDNPGLCEERYLQRRAEACVSSSAQTPTKISIFQRHLILLRQVHNITPNSQAGVSTPPPEAVSGPNAIDSVFTGNLSNHQDLRLRSQYLSLPSPPYDHRSNPTGNVF
jgi:hypothetical protein